MPTARGMSANGAMGADGPRSCTKRLYSTGTNGQSRELLFSDSQKKVWSQFSSRPGPEPRTCCRAANFGPPNELSVLIRRPRDFGEVKAPARGYRNPKTASRNSPRGAVGIADKTAFFLYIW